MLTIHFDLCVRWDYIMGSLIPGASKNAVYINNSFYLNNEHLLDILVVGDS